MMRIHNNTGFNDRLKDTLVDNYIQGSREHGGGGRLPSLRQGTHGLREDAHQAGRRGVQVCTGTVQYSDDICLKNFFSCGHLIT